MPVTVDSQRLRQAFEHYSTFGATADEGLDRPALTDANKAARDALVNDLESDGFDVRIDEVGNVFGRRPGIDDDAPPVLIGSHLDSQPKGGRYDGQLGVLVALETLRTFEDEDLDAHRPVELVCWTGEEGSRFSLTPLGSGAFTGKFSPADARRAVDDDGITVAEELERTGYDGDEPCEAFPIEAYLELHIEQGPILEENGNSVGIVEGIFGSAWLDVTITGEANHAGTTPMHARRDALRTAATAIDAIQSIPQRMAEEVVITTGQFRSVPGTINVIPGEVSFTFDVRSYDTDTIEATLERVESELAHACERNGTAYELGVRHRGHRVTFSSAIRETSTAAAERVGASHQPIVSGAGHDARHLQRVTESGMIFVPSVDGVSHTEDEFTEWSDVEAGANVFAETARRLADR